MHELLLLYLHDEHGAVRVSAARCARLEENHSWAALRAAGRFAFYSWPPAAAANYSWGAARPRSTPTPERPLTLTVICAAFGTVECLLKMDLACAKTDSFFGVSVPDEVAIVSRSVTEGCTSSCRV